MRRNATAVVTFEDHVLMGGFGSAVMEALSEMGIETPVVRIGWPDRFIEHGKVDQLRARHGVSVEAALEKLASWLKRGATPACGAIDVDASVACFPCRCGKMRREPRIFTL